jgi:hypothetical protein
MNAQPSLDQITLVLDGEWDMPADRDMHTAPEFETSGLSEYDCQWDGAGTFAGGGNGYC